MHIYTKNNNFYEQTTCVELWNITTSIKYVHAPQSKIQNFKTRRKCKQHFCIVNTKSSQGQRTGNTIISPSAQRPCISEVMPSHPSPTSETWCSCDQLQFSNLIQRSQGCWLVLGLAYKDSVLCEFLKKGLWNIVYAVDRDGSKFRIRSGSERSVTHSEF